MKATMPESGVVTRQGKPVSIVVQRLEISEEEALKKGMEAKSKEFVGEGAEVDAKV